MRRATLAAGLLTAALVVVGSAARADGPSEEQLAQARSAFSAGVAAQDEGRFADALAAYLEVRKVTASPPLLFNLATCREQLGQLAQAQGDYERAIEAARSKGDAEVERAASASLDALGPRVPHLTVRLPAGLTDLTATLDDHEVSVEALASMPLDPGAHRLLVRSPSRPREFVASFDLAPGALREFEVDLGPTATPPASVTAAPVTPVLPAPQPAPTKSYLPAWISAGGALALGAGALGTGLAASADHDEYLSLNASPTDQNLQRRLDLRSRGETLYIANAALIGLTAVAVGVAVYFFARPLRGKPTAMALAF